MVKRNNRVERANGEKGAQHLDTRLLHSPTVLYFFLHLFFSLFFVQIVRCKKGKRTKNRKDNNNKQKNNRVPPPPSFKHRFACSPSFRLPWNMEHFDVDALTRCVLFIRRRWVDPAKWQLHLFRTFCLFSLSDDDFETHFHQTAIQYRHSIQMLVSLFLSFPYYFYVTTTL